MSTIIVVVATCQREMRQLRPAYEARIQICFQYDFSGARQNMKWLNYHRNALRFFSHHGMIYIHALWG